MNYQPDSPSLIADRRQQLAEAFEESAFDALIVGSPANVAYATGYRSMAGELFRQHQMAAVVHPNSTTLVCPAADAGPAIDGGMDPQRVATYGKFFFEATEQARAIDHLADANTDLASALNAACSSDGLRGRVGVDIAGLGAAWPDIAKRLPGTAEVVDASGWLLEVRATKLPAEIELLRRAAHLAEAGIANAIAGAEPSVTERELADIVAGEMVSGGGKPRFIVVTAGERSALADAFPTDRPLRPGDLLRFDVGCTVNGYWSDIGRTAVLGEPDARVRDHYQAILAGEQAQLDRVEPGVSAASLFEVAVSTVEAGGVTPYRRHHCGHGIGIDVYEPPIINAGTDVPLKSGMTFCFETPYYELGWGGMMVEDTIVVTDDGCEMISTSDRSLQVVPV